MNKRVAVVVVSIFAYSAVISPFGLLLVPAIVFGAICHELCHYLPLKPWGEGLYIEVWPLIDRKDHESAATIAHVGGNFSTNTPLSVVAFATVAPTIMFGLFPLLLAMSSYDIFSLSLSRVAKFVQSPVKLATFLFFIQASIPSTADLTHLRNARKIMAEGSLDKDDWSSGLEG